MQTSKILIYSQTDRIANINTHIVTNVLADKQTDTLINQSNKHTHTLAQPTGTKAADIRNAPPDPHRSTHTLTHTPACYYFFTFSRNYAKNTGQQR